RGGQNRLGRRRCVSPRAIHPRRRRCDRLPQQLGRGRRLVPSQAAYPPEGDVTCFSHTGLGACSRRRARRCRYQTVTAEVSCAGFGARRVGQETVLLTLLPQVLAGDAQDLRGPLDVAAGLLERESDILALGVGEREAIGHLERLAHPARASVAGLERAERNRPACTSCSRSRLVAVTKRRATSSSSVLPNRRNRRLSRTLSSFACSSGPSSAISSRNSVPPSATSMRPRFASRASVKAPFL